MGKFEVLAVLQEERELEERRFLSYTEIHKSMVERGFDYSYVSVWRSIHSLWCDDLIRVKFLAKGLQRQAVFRARPIEDPPGFRKKKGNYTDNGRIKNG